MARMARVCGLLALLLNGGCTSLAVATIDEKISQMTESECSSMRLLVGESYCRSRTVAVAATPVHCFRTLGSVDCYDEADPYGINGSGRSRQPLALEMAPVQASATATGH